VPFWSRRTQSQGALHVLTITRSLSSFSFWELSAAFDEEGLFETSADSAQKSPIWHQRVNSKYLNTFESNTDDHAQFFSA
jgi:hypothetical protein